jgi:hypothetical protein
MTGVEDDKDVAEQINYSFPWIFKGGRERTGPDDGLSTLHQQPEQLWSSWRPTSPSSSESHNNSFFNNPQSFADMRMVIGSRTSGFKLSWLLLFLKGSTLPMPTVFNVKAEQVIRSPTPTPLLSHKIEEQDEEGDNRVTYRGRIGPLPLALAQPRPSRCNNLLHNHAATKITALKDILDVTAAQQQQQPQWSPLKSRTGERCHLSHSMSPTGEPSRRVQTRRLRSRLHASHPSSRWSA